MTTLCSPQKSKATMNKINYCRRRKRQEIGSSLTSTCLFPCTLSLRLLLEAFFIFLRSRSRLCPCYSRNIEPFYLLHIFQYWMWQSETVKCFRLSAICMKYNFNILITRHSFEISVNDHPSPRTTFNLANARLVTLTLGLRAEQCFAPLARGKYHTSHPFFFWLFLQL